MSNDADFGNEQEMAVVDKLRPTLGPTEGSQDVDSRPVNTVGMPAYTDPNNPVAASGSVNLSLNDHPVEHADDFGQVAKDTVGDHAVASPMTDPETAAASKSLEDAPEDRKEWQKTHWQAQAGAYGLATSGNKKTLQKRVEDHEGELEEREQEVSAAKELNAGDWISEVEDTDDEEELAKLRSLYDATGQEFSTVVEAFDAKKAEFDTDDNNGS